MIKLEVTIKPVELKPNIECALCNSPASFMIVASFDDNGTKVEHTVLECSVHATLTQEDCEEFIDGYAEAFGDE